MRQPSRFSEVGFESMKMGVFLLFGRTKRPDLHRTPRQRFSPLSVGSSVGKIWSPLDTRRPLRQFAIGAAAFQTSTLDRTEGIVGKLNVKFLLAARWRG